MGGSPTAVAPLVAEHGLWGVWPSVGVAAGSPVAAPRFYHTGLAVVVCGLSRSAACGITVPETGIEPTSPALPGRLLIPGHQESPKSFS